jgi:AcrR family transcriptional regulator
MKQKSIEKKQQIADAAIKLFLQHGVQGTSMRDIAKALNISTGSIYHHFKSKDEIIDLVAELGAQGVEDTRAYYRSLGNVSPKEALRKCIIQLIARTSAGRANILFFNREWRALSPSRAAALTESVRRYISFFEHLLDEGIRADEFKLENPKLVAFNIWASQQEGVLRGWFLKESFTVEEFAERQADFILNSISISRTNQKDTKFDLIRS